MTFADKIRRLLKPYNQREIAKAAGLNPLSIRNILDGTTKSPHLDTLKGLAAALGVTVGWLADDDASWPPERVRPVTDCIDAAA